MKKKTVTMVTGLALGGALLFSSAYVNAAQVSGYEAYKNALKNTVNLQNETAKVQLSLQDNGDNVLDLTSNLKADRASKVMSSVTTLKSGSDLKTFTNYLQDGKAITKVGDSEQYVLRDDPHKNFNNSDKAENTTIKNSLEVIIDTLVGSMQNEVTAVENADGTKTINIDLNESEITPLVNAVATLAVNNGHHHHHGMKVETNTTADDKDTDDNLKTAIPKLQGDIKIKLVTSTITINKDEVITDQTGKLVLSGQDEQGKAHELTLSFDLGLTDINQTTPDKVDLTGKKVKTVSFSKRGER